MAEAIYAIDEFPDDDRLWRVEWIGGIGHDASVPSDPRIDVCLAQFPRGERNPLSARARSWQTKTRRKIGIGLLPYISVASVWQKRRPVVTDLEAFRHRLRIDTSSGRTVALADLATESKVIPRSSYLFGPSWRHVSRTLLVAVEQDGGPYSVMVPTAEIIRFYYAPSTRLAQALFWGEYNEAFNAEQSGILEQGVVRVRLRRWLEDQDAWTIARYICSPVMQREASKLYNSFQLYRLNSTSVMSEPDLALPCGFPFEGPTMIQGIFLPLPGRTQSHPPRWLILRLERCSAPFPFESVIIDRDNNSTPGENTEDENLVPAWVKNENKSQQEAEKLALDVFQTSEEPRRPKTCRHCRDPVGKQKIGYALEIERTNQDHAILVLARNDLQRIGAGEFQAFLLLCALRRGWVPEEQMLAYRRKTTTHREIVSISVLESRIWRKIEEVFESVAIP